MASRIVPDKPRIFVSHSYEDDEYCRVFVHSLRGVLGGDAVWYDEGNLERGTRWPHIERELRASSHFIAILSPASTASAWVNAEMDAARTLLDKGALHSLLCVTAEGCASPPLPHCHAHIARPDGSGYTAIEAVARVLPIVYRASGTGLPGASISPAPSSLSGLGFVPQTITDPITGAAISYHLPPWCPVAAGPFLMGSDPYRDGKAYDDEQPQHAVTLPAYVIARYPVTVAEYACFIRAGHPAPDAWDYQQADLFRPVVCVALRDAVAYAAWLATLTGQPWRLPTEAEWEKAARGTDGRIYPWGDTFDSIRGNTVESGIGTVTPVGTYPSGVSPCGAQDMAGNVWEWTSSQYRPYPYDGADGSEDPADAAARRVLRGGSWFNGARNARAAYRTDVSPDLADLNLGFRLALAIPIA